MGAGILKQALAAILMLLIIFLAFRKTMDWSTTDPEGPPYKCDLSRPCPPESFAFKMKSGIDMNDPEGPPYKCDLSRPCPPESFAFKMKSGIANVLGPKICLEDNILMSGVRNNVGRGLNIALVNGSTGIPIETAYFDMWAGDVKLLINFLKSIEEGTLVMMATFDDSSTKLNEEARKLIGDLGSSSINKLGLRDNWIFVGGKGIKRKSPFEQHLVNNADTNKYEAWPDFVEMEGCIPIRTDRDA